MASEKGKGMPQFMTIHVALVLTLDLMGYRGLDLVTNGLLARKFCDGRSVLFE